MGTFRRGTWHTKRKMKSFTDFLLVGFVTMLWSTSVNGDGNAPNATGVFGFDENYCRGKPDGVFCKLRDISGNNWIAYHKGECCGGECIDHEIAENVRLPTCAYEEFCYNKFDGDNTPCIFKNANNEYEDGICCLELCSPLSSGGCDFEVKWNECAGKVEGEKCDYIELGYDRTYHIIDGKCCSYDKFIHGPAAVCIRDSDEC